MRRRLRAHPLTSATPPPTAMVISLAGHLWLPLSARGEGAGGEDSPAGVATYIVHPGDPGVHVAPVGVGVAPGVGVVGSPTGLTGITV